MIRREVADFTALGKLPSEDGEPNEDLGEAVERAGALLDLIERPVTDEEAHALADCFGVAWVLLHLIETAPHAREDQPEAARRWRDGLTGQ